MGTEVKMNGNIQLKEVKLGNFSPEHLAGKQTRPGLERGIALPPSE